MMKKQILLKIEDVEVPAIEKEGDTYYPVTFIEKHLLKRGKNSFAAGIKKEYLHKFELDFSRWEGGVQRETNCVNKEILTDRLLRTQRRRLTEEQLESQNKLHRFLNIEELDNTLYEWEKFDRMWLKSYDSYTKGLVMRIVEDNNIKTYRKCKMCDIILPLLENFFPKEAGGTIAGQCKRCSTSRSEYTSDDKYERYLQKIDISVVDLYRDDDIIGLFNVYKDKKIGRLPEEFYTKDNLRIIIDHLFKSGHISSDNLTQSFLFSEYRIILKNYDKSTITQVYQWLYGEKFYLDKWKYPKYTFSGEIVLTKELAVEIFDRYLYEFSIEIEDPPNFDYYEVINKSYITGILGRLFKGLCEFFVYYWKGKYAGYHFRELGNYYRTVENSFINDLKHLAEVDLKLQIEKIPLYITKGTLHRDYKNMYNYMRRDGRELFYWFDKLYPGKFIESDFTVGRYRNEFDSIEEQQVDGILRDYFDNVIYNYNSSDQIVELKGKRPDWFIMTERGVWLVEYFGMYREDQEYNPIVSDYMENTHIKLDLYKEMTGYNFLLVYPKDIDRDFLGLRDKLEKMKLETV